MSCRLVLDNEFTLTSYFLLRIKKILEEKDVSLIEIEKSSYVYENVITFSELHKKTVINALNNLLKGYFFVKTSDINVVSCSLIYSYRIDPDKIVMYISQESKEYYKKFLDIYDSEKLEKLLSMKSTYSHILYDYLLRNEDEITVDLADLHDLLDTPESFRKNYSDFKRRVLKQFSKDLNKTSSVYKEIFEGKKVTKIYFDSYFLKL